MKSGCLVFLALSLMALAGCETAPRTAAISLQVGMSRDDLRLHFGEPLRIEPAASGGENWYYRFVAWQTRPTQDSGISNEYGQMAPYASSGLDVSNETVEYPIHVSSGGYVIEPLPKGKVVHK
jgi:outer membrane protein assembly factor BamE (lipoprotein component of BamABCDE complex)